MNIKSLFILMSAAFITYSCNQPGSNAQEESKKDTFHYEIDRFADVKVLKYQIPGWEKLSLQQKKYVYYLTQAGMEGRDIMWDQNYKYNLKIREALENVYTRYEGDKNSEEWKNFETYLKRVWFSNGIHHHYSMDKLKPGFDEGYLSMLLETTGTNLDGDAFKAIFNKEDTKKVNLDKEKGLIKGSAVNFYGDDITAEEVDAFYKAKKSPHPEQPLSFGLNAQLVKEDGVLKERVWKSGGMYGEAIDKIIEWLKKAAEVAENKAQADALKLLIEYYETGDLKTWDDYNIAWTKATEGDIDYINGFIEVYNDPKGFKGSFEAVVQINDFEMSEKMKIVGEHAQWFEDHSPIMDEHKKKNVVGVTYKTVNVAGESGDASPSTPIGINLPNAEWIREAEGSKSVSLGNIISAYEKSGGKERLKEFANDEEEIELAIKYGQTADNIHTALHEVIGHASGRINKGVGNPNETLKNYASTIEEGRADLVGLYYILDPKMEELGLTDNYRELGEAGYDQYIRNGLLVQLIRIEEGNDIEESHMRNRHWISQWVFEKGQDDQVIEKVERDGKTYYNITDYDKLRTLFGDLLREVQRIKSEGDFEAAKNLVEEYGVKIDPKLHREVLERNEPIASPPYAGFVNPYLTPETDDDGEITDIKVEQPESFVEQMLRYSKEYGNLPLEN